MQIDIFEINSEKTKIEITITDASDVSSIYLFDNISYKDYNKALDLTDKATGDSTINFTLDISDLANNKLETVYYLEVKDTSGKLEEGLLLNIDNYHKCIINKQLQSNGCSECLDVFNSALVNSFNTLQVILMSYELGYIEELFIAAKNLDNYCTKCKDCGDYLNY